MSKPVSELTYKIVAFPDIQQLEADEIIDWALEMIELGHESRALYMLASINKPANYFEAIGYMKKAIAELNLELRTGDEATLSYASFYLHQIAREDRVRKRLSELNEFCQKRGYEELVDDFYLLDWAWDQIDHDDADNNHYWDGADRKNIEQIVVREARKWIEKNRHKYEQD